MANRIQLVKWDLNHLQALNTSKDDLGVLLGVSMPMGWPHFPEAYTLPTNEAEKASLGSEWGGYFFIDAQAGALVGSGGFHGEPDTDGDVEIGYEIATEYWNQGYGSEAARLLTQFAFTHAAVQSVSATTLAEVNASNALLKKIGMVFVREIADKEHGTLWRWGIKRDEAMR